MRHGRRALRATALLPCAAVLLVTPLTSAASAPLEHPVGPPLPADTGRAVAEATGSVRLGVDAVRDATRHVDLRELAGGVEAEAGTPALTSRSAPGALAAAPGAGRAEKSPAGDGTSAPSPHGGRENGRTAPGSPADEDRPADGDPPGDSRRTHRPSGPSGSSASSRPSGSSGPSDPSGTRGSSDTERHPASTGPDQSRGPGPAGHHHGRRHVHGRSPESGPASRAPERTSHGPHGPGRAERRKETEQRADAEGDGPGNGNGNGRRSGKGGSDAGVEGGILGDDGLDGPGLGAGENAAGAAEQEAGAPAARRVSPVLPLGAGLTSIGLGLGLLALRLRRG